MHITVLTHSRY